MNPTAKIVVVFNPSPPGVNGRVRFRPAHQPASASFATVVMAGRSRPEIPLAAEAPLVLGISPDRTGKKHDADFTGRKPTLCRFGPATGRHVAAEQAAWRQGLSPRNDPGPPP